MLHIENEYIREHLLDGAFGIEMESLRVVGDGMLSQTAHPFPGDAHIVRDFSENQTEINTGVNESIEAAIERTYQKNSGKVKGTSRARIAVAIF